LAGALHAAGTRTTAAAAGRLGRRALVAAEVSLSLMLLIGAAQLVDSFLRLQRVDPGFDPSHAVTAEVQIPLPGPFSPATDGPRWQLFFAQLMDRLHAAPGVHAAGAVSSLPLTGAEESSRVIIPERPAERPELNPSANYAIVSGDYFTAMGMPVLAGRGFTTADGADAPQVIIVNREFVERYLAGSDVVGRRLTGMFEFSAQPNPRTVVGVVGDVQQTSLAGPALPTVYVPQSQMPYPSLSVVIRTVGDSGPALGALRRAVKDLNPDAAVAQERTLAAVLDQSLARQRFSSTLIAVFAAAALLLAMVGVYGVIAVTVGQRRREVGIRMALGARHAHVLRLVLGEGARIIAAGVALGLLGAFGSSRLIRALVFEAGAAPAGVFGGSALAIALMALVATYVPARRAARLDPMRALRED
jgi:putative ABC transport system permease protein